ncbi:Transposon Ty3-I Gag-Pol polyprotein [Sesamum angolense]|uniref:Transposon Ty3-I Gag-Pol polyprotein n=1 Tax=Sesamum angolense TaxID=2727404 RepID=A0AAE1WQC9_9LAMI|nr:Transposon Ty3-I Gag-Pol polyprotein [Sesamum angolense]
MRRELVVTQGLRPPSLVYQVPFIGLEIFRLLGTTLAYSSSYHPQSDSQTEVLNRCLETYLRYFVSEEPTRWTQFLLLAEFWYNTSFHSAIGMSPFEALYGRKPPSLAGYSPSNSKFESLDSTFSTRQTILQLLKSNLRKAQHPMAHQFNSKRLDWEFHEGGLGFPQASSVPKLLVQRHSSQKLFPRYFGPFRILRRIETVAYELELPPAARIHPVFHVSLLKPCYGSPRDQICPLLAAPPPPQPRFLLVALFPLRLVPSVKSWFIGMVRMRPRLHGSFLTSLLPTILAQALWTRPFLMDRGMLGRNKSNLGPNETLKGLLVSRIKFTILNASISRSVYANR